MAPAIYDQPEEATIRWPAPPLFTIEDEQQRVKQQVRKTFSFVSYILIGPPDRQKKQNKLFCCIFVSLSG